MEIVPPEGGGEGGIDEDDIEFGRIEGVEPREGKVGRREGISVYRCFFKGEETLLFWVSV